MLACAACTLVISTLNGCLRPRVRAFTNLSVNYNLKLPSGEMVTITDAHGNSFEDVDHTKRLPDLPQDRGFHGCRTPTSFWTATVPLGWSSRKR